jgi:hypothetical protein
METITIWNAFSPPSQSLMKYEDDCIRPRGNDGNTFHFLELPMGFNAIFKKRFQRNFILGDSGSPGRSDRA